MSVLTPTDEISVECLDTLKRTLNTSDIAKKKEVIQSLAKILNTYKDAVANKISDFPDLPKIILQVDMIHAISQVMATSDAELFSCTLNLLNSIYGIPVLRGKLGIVVEAGLRVASIVVKSDYAVIAKARQFFLEVLKDLESVPWAIQRQIIAVYRKLPLWLDTNELLEWTQLLLFCPTLLDTLPQKVYTDFIRVLIAHHNMDKVGVKCLNFLADSFKKLSHRTVREICIGNNDFLKLLNEQICRSCPYSTTEEGFSEIVYSFQIVHRYVVAVGAFKEKVENVHVIKWNLTKSIPILLHYALGDAVLNLVTELLHQDFKTDVLIVEENDPTVRAKVLSTIHFVALSSAHKAVIVESQISVWVFLNELFRFSGRESGEALRQFRPELNPWNLITFAVVFLPNEPLLSHPIEFWKFVFEWVKLLANKKKSIFEISQSNYSGFNYGTFVGTLQTRIRSENLTSSSDKCFPSVSQQDSQITRAPYLQTVAPYSQFSQTMAPFSQTMAPFSQTMAPFSQTMASFSQTMAPFSQTMAPFSQTMTPYSQMSNGEKEHIIIKIGDICSRLSDKSIDWDSKNIEIEPFPQSPMSSQEGEISERQELGQEQESQECQNISSGSETGSESDFVF